VDNYLPINLVMSTIWAWYFFPLTAREALGPTSPTARPSSSRPDDPSLEPAQPSGQVTVSVRTWRASV
jgi:hypothetical protein